QLTEIAYRGRRQLLCRISDGSGMLTLRFFHFSASQQQGLARGTRLRCFGEVRRGALGLEMVHPEYRRLTGEAVPLDDTLTPIYPLTEGVPQGRLRSLIGEALRELDRTALRDWLPRGAVLPPGLPSLGEALHYLHHPPRAAQLAELAAGRHPAQRRLAFEELLAHHLTLRLRKRALKSDPAWALADGEGLARRFLAALPFALTRAQAGALAGIAGGQVRVVVGTHALCQEGIEFAALALVIVDEQHRFGVQQRLQLSEKGHKQGRLPHQLIMTATPIPRTLAMTAYADLDISVIEELPPGRTPVQTVVVPEQRRSEVVARIAQACRAGRQAYWVCPLIDESDELRA